MVRTFPEAIGASRSLALVFALLTMVLLGHSAPAAPQAEQARELIETIGADVLEILQNEALSDQETLDRLEDVLEGPIDLDLVARLILGRHWRTASEAQREQYLELFRAYALDNVASKLHLYEGQEFEITDAQVVSARDAMVTTRIMGGGQPLNVNWRLRELDSGDLVAIDVVVENVSLIVTLRSEFGSVIERQGMDGLLAELRQRIRSPA